MFPVSFFSLGTDTMTIEVEISEGLLVEGEIWRVKLLNADDPLLKLELPEI